MHIVLRFVYLENAKRESSDQQREAEERGCAARDPSVSNLERGLGTCSCGGSNWGQCAGSVEQASPHAALAFAAKL